MRLFLLWPLVIACNGSKPDGGTSGGGDTDGTAGGACEDDDACGTGRICEGGDCVAGDRDNDADHANVVEVDEDDDSVLLADDVDWWTFSVDEPGFVRVSTEVLDGEIDTVVAIYDGDGTLVAWEDEHPAGSLSTYDSVCYAYLPHAGDWYATVQDVTMWEDGTSATEGGYDLAVSALPAVTEPDALYDTFYDYDVAGANTWYSLPVLIEEAGDVDYVSMDLPDADVPIYVLAQQHAESSDLTPVVQLYDADARLVMQATDPSSDAVAVLPASMGTHYVLGVSDAGGAAGEATWGFVFFKVGEPGDGNPAEIEPDDDVGSATALTMEDQQPDAGRWSAGFAQGRMDLPGDADVFSFDVEDDTYVTVRLGAQSYGSLLAARLELLDASGAVLDTVDSTAGADVDAENLGPYPAGTYYLRVSAEPDSTATDGEGAYYLFGVHATSFQL